MPKRAELQYHIRNVSAPGADYNVQPVTAAGIDGTGVVIAVLDDGFQVGHPAFAGRFSAGLSFDYVSGLADPSGNPGDGHGTAVAAVALGDRGWGGPIGVAPGATLAALRINLGVAPVPGSPSTVSPPDADTSSVTAIRQAAKTADVANNSWGPSPPFVGVQTYDDVENRLLRDAIGDAVATGRNGRGLVIVFAAGNDGDSGADVSYSAINSDPRVITVGGLDPDGRPTLELTHGAGLLVTGPARAVVTAQRFVPDGSVDANGLPTGSYQPILGTSFAAPGVSGVVALMLQANAKLGWRDVQEILVDAAKIPGANAITKPDGTPWFTNAKSGDFNGGGRHYSNAYGYGLPDADVAVALARTWTPAGDSTTLMTATVAGPGGLGVVGGGPVASTSLSYGASLRVQHVQVSLKAPALQTSSLRITVTAPDGTRSVVSDQAGVNQEAATQAAGPGAPVGLVGSDGKPLMKDDGTPFLNTAPLNFTLNNAAFWGVDARGTWTLELLDYKTGETGTLDGWGLTFWGDAGTAPQVLVYTPEFRAMAAADPARTQVRGNGVDSTLNAASLSGEVRIDLNGGAGLLDGVAVTVQGGVANAVGGRGATTLIGTAGANRLTAGEGAAFITGLGGGDVLIGGMGQDTIVSGGDSIVVTGTKGSLVVLAADDILLSHGADVAIAGQGEALVGAFDAGLTLFGGAGELTFVNAVETGGASTVVGGSGSATLFGGSGGGVLAGGSGGRNVIVAGTGAATVLGGGNGDVIFAQGAARQVVSAASGNATLNGAAASGGTTFFAGSGANLLSLGSGGDTVFAGTGQATVFAGAGPDVFAFTRGRAGGSSLVSGFDLKQDRITLQGYGAAELQGALGGAKSDAAGTTITLSDNTRVTFVGVGGLGASAFF